MATAESVKAKIQGLIDTANEATGNSDTDLTTAVGALVAGFGQGGGGSYTDEQIAALIGRTVTEFAIHNGVTTIGTRAFQNCEALTSITIPDSVTSIGNYAFMDCTTLTEVKLPNDFSSRLGSDTFRQCSQLTKIDFGKCTFLGYQTLYFDANLKTIILRVNAVCAIPAVGTLHGVGTTEPCTVYVPSAQIENYQAATNWSTLYTDGRIVFAAIEGSEYE